MAVARITQHFSEDTAIVCEVEVMDSFPQSCAEAVAQVVALYHMACPDGDED